MSLRSPTTSSSASRSESSRVTPVPTTPRPSSRYVVSKYGSDGSSMNRITEVNSRFARGIICNSSLGVATIGRLFPWRQRVFAIAVFRANAAVLSVNNEFGAPVSCQLGTSCDCFTLGIANLCALSCASSLDNPLTAPLKNVDCLFCFDFLAHAVELEWEPFRAPSFKARTAAGADIRRDVLFTQRENGSNDRSKYLVFDSLTFW